MEQDLGQGWEVGCCHPPQGVQSEGSARGWVGRATQPKLGMGAPQVEQEICPLQHREVDEERQTVLIRPIMGGYNTLLHQCSDANGASLAAFISFDCWQKGSACTGCSKQAVF